MQQTPLPPGSGTQPPSHVTQEEDQEQPEEERSITESRHRESQQEPLRKKRKLRRRTTFCTICHTKTCEGASDCEEKERQKYLQQETTQEEERKTRRVLMEQPTLQLNGEPMDTEVPAKEPPQQPTHLKAKVEAVPAASSQLTHLADYVSTRLNSASAKITEAFASAAAAAVEVVTATSPAADPSAGTQAQARAWHWTGIF